MRTYATIISLILAGNSFGQDKVKLDSNAVVRLPEVVVTASRSRGLFDRTAANTVILDAQSMGRLTGLTVDAALTRETAAYVRDIGGGAGIKTVSLRGSSANQTVILFNGTRLNSAQNGLVDLGLYPLDLFERMEIVRGGQSASFGSDAIGGSINLVTGGMIPRNRIGVRATGGSFGLLGGMIDAGFAGEKSSFVVRGGYESSHGQFPFDAREGADVISGTREGTSYHRTFGLADASMAWGEGQLLSFTILAVSADRGSPGPVTRTGSTQARLIDDAGNAVVRYTQAVQGGVAEGGVFGGLQLEKYHDISTTLQTTETYRNSNLGGWFQWSGSISEGLEWLTGVEASRSDVRSRVFPASTDRASASFQSGFRWTPISSGWTILPALRYDSFSDVGEQWCWKVASMFPLDGDGRSILRGTVGTSFRAPSFNELYWIPGGNPFLRHEAGISFDAGVDFLLDAFGEHKVSLTFFSNTLSDRIVGFPPENVSRSRAIGVEGDWIWDVGENLRLHMATSMNNVESLESGMEGLQLPFIPRFTFSGGATFDVFGFAVAPTVIYASRRYSTMDNIRSLSADPYSVLHSTVAKSTSLAGFPINMILSIENLLDADYQVTPGYPMPGRSFRCSLVVQFNETNNTTNTP